ncbi:unnamed protein product [Prunus armeniaca]
MDAICAMLMISYLSCRRNKDFRSFWKRAYWGEAINGCLNSEERDLVNIFASLSLKPSNLPARDAPWKGGFILDAATPGEFIGGLKTTM